jgi:undecaprenyl-diphosphatase
LLFLAERLAAHQRHLAQLTLKDSVLIGLAQALAIFPGVSRSGSTITAGLALGLERETAARFSFLLSAPIVAGAGVKSIFGIAKEMQAGMTTGSDFMLFAVGFVAAAISGYFCIKVLLRFLQKHPTDIFAYYRWMLALLVLVVALARG